MSVNVVVEPFDNGYPDPNTSFRPQLYVVSPDSYAMSNYGAGATSLGNYNTVTMRNSSNSRASTICSIFRESNDISFMMNLSINISGSDPLASLSLDPDSELRVRVLPLLPNEPARYKNTFPPANIQHSTPKFTDGEIVVLDPDTNVVVSEPPLSARLLADNTLALLSSSSGNPVTIAEIPWENGANNRIMNFIIDGGYKSY